MSLQVQSREIELKNSLGNEKLGKIQLEICHWNLTINKDKVEFISKWAVGKDTVGEMSLQVQSKEIELKNSSGNKQSRKI